MEFFTLNEWTPLLATFKWPAVVALAAQILYLYVTAQVGMARYKHKIWPPKTTGHPDFDRIFRVQMNFVEQFPFFVLGLLLCSVVLSGNIGAVLGGAWVVFRALYGVRYASAPLKKDVYLYTGPQYLAVLLMYLLPVIRLCSS